jgi:hypothetical protein
MTDQKLIANLRLEWSEGGNQERRTFQTIGQLVSFLKANPELAVKLQYYKKVSREQLTPSKAY